MQGQRGGIVPQQRTRTAALRQRARCWSWVYAHYSTTQCVDRERATEHDAGGGTHAHVPRPNSINEPAAVLQGPHRSPHRRLACPAALPCSKHAAQHCCLAGHGARVDCATAAATDLNQRNPEVCALADDGRLDTLETVPDDRSLATVHCQTAQNISNVRSSALTPQSFASLQGCSEAREATTPRRPLAHTRSPTQAER